MAFNKIKVGRQYKTPINGLIITVTSITTTISDDLRFDVMIRYTFQDGDDYAHLPTDVEYVSTWERIKVE